MSSTQSIARALAQSGLVPLDAQVVLAHVLAKDRAWLVAHADEPLTLEQEAAFFALAKRRRDGEPVAYLTGVREFWGLPLRVSPAVLIPRPETESLVELALCTVARRPGSAACSIWEPAPARSRLRSHASGRARRCSRPTFRRKRSLSLQRMRGGSASPTSRSRDRTGTPICRPHGATSRST